MELRDCQQAAIKCFQERQAAGEGQTNLSLCTGAGKSLIIEHITSNVGGRVIIVFPWLLLMQQYFDKHKAAYAKSPCMYFATEGTLRGIQRLSDDMRELASPAYIIFTTYTSAPQIYARIGAKRCVDLICHDEAHRTQRPQYSAAFDLIVGNVRHVANLSATLPQEAHYKYSLLRGIKDGVVRDFHMELLMCSSRERNDTNLIVKIVEKLKVQHRQVKLLVYTSEANTDGPNSSSVKTFMDTHAQTLRGLGWWIEGINADTEAEGRTALFRAFEQHRDVSVLVSCKTLSEGIDLHGANCMLPWDPSNSIIDNIQRIGRVLRLYKTKDGKIAKCQPASSILIPVFLEESKYLACEGDREKVSEMLAGEIGEAERGNFRAIVNVCTALKSELAEEDEELYNRLLNYPNETTVSVDMSLVECVAKKCKKEAEKVLEDIASKLEEKGLEADDVRDGAWDEDMNDDVAHALADTLGITLTVSDGDEVNIFGNGPVSVNVKKEDDNYVVVRGKKDADAAAKKQVAQRISYDFSDGCKILLGLETIESADMMGGMVLTRLTTEVQVDKNWDKRLEEWEKQFNILRRTPNKHSENSAEKRAGIWQCQQRQLYKKNKMLQSRIEKLEHVRGWEWEKGDTWEPQRQNWIKQNQILNNKLSSLSTNIDECRAAIWQTVQRREYKQNKLVQERIEILNNTPGWKWEEDDTWEPQRQNWIQQRQKLGKNPSAKSLILEEKRAAIWQNHQRKAYRDGKMSDEYIDKLNTTPEWKWEEDDTWEIQRQNWVLQYTNRSKMPIKVLRWQSQQRNAFKKGELSQLRIDTLNGTQGWKWSEDDIWEQQRQNWIKRHQNIALNTADPEEKRAVQWQGKQRQAYKKNELSQQRIDILNKTPGWKWEEDDIWELQRQHWIQQYDKLGKPPTITNRDNDERSAGIWQQHQRQEYKKNKLTQARIEILNSTPGWKWEKEDTWEPNRQNWIKQYKKLGKHPSNESIDREERRAGQWRGKQCDTYKKGKLSQEYIVILENTPGWLPWIKNDKPQLRVTWAEQYSHWQSQFTKLGRTPSGESTNEEERRAKHWQGNQCMLYKNGKLLQEYIQILNNTPGWKWDKEDTWEPNRQNWIKQYQQLGRAPSQISNNLQEKRLAKWQSGQRRGYKNKDSWMTQERIEILNNTPGWKWEEDDTWEPNRQNWIQQRQKLGRNPSHASKDEEEKRAGQWQSGQRKGYKNKHNWMTPQRIEILNNTPGWTWSSNDVPVTPAKAPRIRRLKLPTTTAAPTGRPHVPSQLEQFHKRFKSMNASTYKSTITAAEFAEYHAIADTYDARDPPERQPLNKIATMLSKSNKSTYSAIDLGCGKNRLRAHPQVSRMRWTSLDVHAADDTVTVADMAALPYEDETYDVAVLSRSLWARNHMDVLTETFRILKSGGRAIICESFRRWQEAAAGAGSDTLINGLLRDLGLVGFEIIQEEGTSVNDAVDDVFQYIVVRKP